MTRSHRIAAAVDLSAATAGVLAAARWMAKALQARIHVFHVVHDLSKYMGFYIGAPPVGELQATIEKEAREKLAQAAAAAFRDALDVEVELHVLRGTPFSDLCLAVERLGPELLVVGAHGAEKPEHQIFGSTAERLVKAAPCPVLVVGQRPPRR